MDISRYMDQHLNEIRPSIQFTVEVDDRGSLSNQGYRSKLFTHRLVQEPKVPPELASFPAIDRSILGSVMNMPDLVRHIHCLREIFDVWQIIVVIT